MPHLHSRYGVGFPASWNATLVAGQANHAMCGGHEDE